MNNQIAGCSHRRIIHSKEKEEPNYYMSNHQMTPWRITLGEKSKLKRPHSVRPHRANISEMAKLWKEKTEWGCQCAEEASWEGGKRLSPGNVTSASNILAGMPFKALKILTLRGSGQGRRRTSVTLPSLLSCSKGPATG